MNNLLLKTIAVFTTVTSTSITMLALIRPASAAIFTPFSFNTHVTATPASDPNSGLLNDPTRDVRLDSVEFQGTTVTNFELVNKATILQNDTYTLADGTVAGVLHVGRGPNTANDPLITEGPSKINPTATDIVETLGNLNLNSILVTRENADRASIEVSFANPVNTFFFWERGGTAGGPIAGDSDLLVEALSDDYSTVLASYKILRSNYTKANYNISTQVFPVLNNGPFNIGSIGIRLGGITTKTLRLTSANNNGLRLDIPRDNGPDFKVLAANVPVPEPMTLLGVATASIFGTYFKLKRTNH
ncbi:exosortase-dependent surface protein XDP2 [Gloeothece verrucosa]|uniref:PEP-CTERM protein-sorting domain-containing protein n=1 Tax=Gloeothece verrucosa (strain PCC 7822) TaxID=497965 RepID=E0UL06_GLOV7|nr:exosortase-dependent surface protein XDP2 [Gloeothece verrucosa]ADN17636.1 conserved hypothetical protein [Gloeothece verrucosa PCC 7822]